MSEIVVPAQHIATVATRYTRRLAMLKAPDAPSRAYVRLMLRQAADIRSIARAAKAGDAAKMATLGARNSDYIARQEGIATGYGFKVCGRR